MIIFYGNGSFLTKLFDAHRRSLSVTPYTLEPPEKPGLINISLADLELDRPWTDAAEKRSSGTYAGFIGLHPLAFFHAHPYLSLGLLFVAGVWATIFFAGGWLKTQFNRIRGSRLDDVPLLLRSA
jgi:hypothetical protein